MPALAPVPGARVPTPRLQPLVVAGTHIRSTTKAGRGTGLRIGASADGYRVTSL